MAPHSSTLALKIPWTEEPGRLQSMGSWRVRHDWATSLSLLTFMHWRWKWQPTPVFLPGESQGRGSLVGCRLWGRTEWLSSSSDSLVVKRALRFHGEIWKWRYTKHCHWILLINHLGEAKDLGDCIYNTFQTFLAN